MLRAFLESFHDLPEPRTHRGKIRHQLIDIITITLCAVLCGAEDWVDVEDFGEAKREWFETFLDLPGGIPSHDTFSRVFAMIDPEAFGSCFISWVSGMTKPTKGRVVPIDGKTVRGSQDGRYGGPLHMVNAYCVEHRMVLGQLATEEKSNEITAIPGLLEILDVRDAIIAIDAMGAQREIVSKIRAKGADYVIGCKNNQPRLREAIEETFVGIDLEHLPGEGVETHVEDDNSHGRQLTRGVFVTDDLSLIPNPEKWKDLRSIAMAINEFVDGNGRLVAEKRYFISSLDVDAKQFAQTIRAHWQIENALHWVLDVTFREDYSRVRADNGAANLVAMRHAALNLVRQEKRTKGSIKTKRKRAGWVNSYLEELVFQA